MGLPPACKGRRPRYGRRLPRLGDGRHLRRQDDAGPQDHGPLRTPRRLHRQVACSCRRLYRDRHDRDSDRLRRQGCTRPDDAALASQGADQVLQGAPRADRDARDDGPHDRHVLPCRHRRRSARSTRSSPSPSAGHTASPGPSAQERRFSSRLPRAMRRWTS